jgi:hypothetical protein
VNTGILAAAMNVASLESPPAPRAATAGDPLRAVTDALSTLASAANLLAEGGSALAHRVAGELVRAEAARAASAARVPHPR